MIPDQDNANKIIEKEYQELLREQYILFRHLRISFADQDRLTSEDRRFLIEEFIKEKQAEAEASSSSKKSSSYNLPPSGGGGIEG